MEGKTAGGRETQDPVVALPFGILPDMRNLAVHRVWAAGAGHTLNTANLQRIYGRTSYSRYCYTVYAA